MTFDSDMGSRRSKATVFGIHGLAYGGLKPNPINIKNVISKAIGRKFSMADDKLTPAETKKAHASLRVAYERELKKASSPYVGGDIETWVRDEDVQQNLIITRRYVHLLGEAVLQKKGVYFQ